MKKEKIKKIVLRSLGICGVLIFGSIMFLTYSTPEWVERFGAEFIEKEVSKQIDQTIDNIKPPSNGGAISKMANAIYESNQERIDELKARLKAEVHERMASALAEVRDLDCECRKKWASVIKQGFEFEIALLQAANDKIVELIQSKYMVVVSSLKRDIRIFTGTNLVVFLLLLFVSFLKPRAISHLFLPGSLLAVSTIICAYFYVFQQNWILTIVYSDYVGIYYIGYLGAVFVLLCDIFFNRARVTTNIINFISSLIGSAASLSPC